MQPEWDTDFAFFGRKTAVAAHSARCPAQRRLLSNKVRSYGRHRRSGGCGGSPTSLFALELRPNWKVAAP